MCFQNPLWKKLRKRGGGHLCGSLEHEWCLPWKRDILFGVGFHLPYENRLSHISRTWVQLKISFNPCGSSSSSKKNHWSYCIPFNNFIEIMDTNLILGMNSSFTFLKLWIFLLFPEKAKMYIIRNHSFLIELLLWCHLEKPLSQSTIFLF